MMALLRNGKENNEMRITRKYPEISWRRTWKNLHMVGLPDPVTSKWYTAIHDIVHTNERLATIHLTPTTDCQLWGTTDTLLHKITACEEGPVIWNWTRPRTAAIPRVHPRHISAERTVRPAFHFWPPQRHAAILWILAHLVVYRIQTHRRLTLADYMDFLQRARWNQYQRAPKRQNVGRYLDIL
jgi:hypothetical protein